MNSSIDNNIIISKSQINSETYSSNNVEIHEVDSSSNLYESNQNQEINETIDDDQNNTSSNFYTEFDKMHELDSDFNEISTVENSSNSSLFHEVNFDNFHSFSSDTCSSKDNSKKSEPLEVNSKAQIYLKNYLKLKQKLINKKKNISKIENDSPIFEDIYNDKYKISIAQKRESFSENSIQFNTECSTISDQSSMRSILKQFANGIVEKEFETQSNIDSHHPISEISKHEETKNTIESDIFNEIVSNDTSNDTLSNDISIYSSDNSSNESIAFLDSSDNSSFSEYCFQYPEIKVYPINNCEFSTNSIQEQIDSKYIVTLKNLIQYDGYHSGKKQGFNIHILDSKNGKKIVPHKHDILVEFDLVQQISNIKVLDYNIEFKYDHIQVSFYTLKCGLFNFSFRILIDGTSYCLFDESLQNITQMNQNRVQKNQIEYAIPKENNPISNNIRYCRSIPIYISPGMLKEFVVEFRTNLKEVDFIQLLLKEKNNLMSLYVFTPPSTEKNLDDSPNNSFPESLTPISPSLISEDKSLEAQIRLFIHQYSKCEEDLRRLKLSLKTLLSEENKLNKITEFIENTHNERINGFQRYFFKYNKEDLGRLKLKKFETTSLEINFVNLLKFLKILKRNNYNGEIYIGDPIEKKDMYSNKGDKILMDISDSLKFIESIYGNCMKMEYHAFWREIYAISSYCFPRRAFITTLLFFFSCILEYCCILEVEDKGLIFRTMEILYSCKSDSNIPEQWKDILYSLQNSIKEFPYLQNEKKELYLLLLKGYIFNSKCSTKLYSMLIQSNMSIAISLLRLSLIFAASGQDKNTLNEILEDCVESVKNSCKKAIKLTFNSTWVKNSESILYMLLRLGDIGNNFMSDQIRYLDIIKRYVKGSSEIGNEINEIKGNIKIFGFQLESHFDKLKKKQYTVGYLMKRNIVVPSPENKKQIQYTNYNITLSCTGSGELKWLLRNANNLQVVTEVKLHLIRFLNSKEMSIQVGPIWVHRIQMLELFKKYIK